MSISSDLLRVFRSYFEGKGAFEGMGLPHLRQNYFWPNCGLSSWPLSGMEANSKLIGRTYDLQMELFEEVHKEWLSVNPDGKFQIAKWIIKDWGGIAGIGDKRIYEILASSQAGQKISKFQGISSTSKVYAFSDPQNHAIYDSRVALSLNLVQRIHFKGSPPQKGVYFRVPPGRSKALQPAFEELKRQRISGANWIGRIASQSESYPLYIELISRIRARYFPQEADLRRFEMALYSDAERLQSQAGL